MITIAQIKQDSIKDLQKAKIPNPLLETEVIISSVLKKDRYKIHTEDYLQLTDQQRKKILQKIKRRLNFEPLAYILGKKEFYSLEFMVNNQVLVPRPETEFLVDLVLEQAPLKSKILDLGTGSGAIAIALKHYRSDLKIFASDISSTALKVAQKNSLKLLGERNISFYQGDLFKPLAKHRFDFIVSNPPYLSFSSREKLPLDLSFEPPEALFAKEHGLKIIKKIINQSKKYLNPQGSLLLEIDPLQQEDLKKLAEDNHFKISFQNDYLGNPRIALLK